MAVSRGPDTVIKGEINITGYTPVKNILCVGCQCPGLGKGPIRRAFSPMNFASGLNIVFGLLH